MNAEYEGRIYDWRVSAADRLDAERYVDVDS